jgi:hypothetical protein
MNFRFSRTFEGPSSRRQSFFLPGAKLPEIESPSGSNELFQRMILSEKSCNFSGSCFRHVSALLLGAVFSSLMYLPGPADASPARVEVTISQRRLSNGDVRFTVPVRIGHGSTMEAMLDTGSFGLRIMARALAGRQYQTTGIVRNYGYASGVVLHGPLARSLVAIGGATSGRPINIQIVQSVFCDRTMPLCPAARVTPDDYKIGGDGLPREGVDAILGLSMRMPDAVDAAINPLAAFGADAWIIILPRPRASGVGKLIINPSPHDVAGFQAVRLMRAPSKQPAIRRK